MNQQMAGPESLHQTLNLGFKVSEVQPEMPCHNEFRNVLRFQRILYRGDTYLCASSWADLAQHRGPRTC
jgi:hypothetical protein